MKKILLMALFTYGLMAKQYVIRDVECIRILGEYKGWFKENPVFKGKDGSLHVIKKDWGILDEQTLISMNPKYFCKIKDKR